MSLETIIGFAITLGSIVFGYGKLMQEVKQLKEDSKRNFKQHEDFYAVEKKVIRMEEHIDVKAKD